MTSFCPSLHIAYQYCNDVRVGDVVVDLAQDIVLTPGLDKHREPVEARLARGLPRSVSSCTQLSRLVSVIWIRIRKDPEYKIDPGSDGNPDDEKKQRKLAKKLTNVQILIIFNFFSLI